MTTDKNPDAPKHEEAHSYEDVQTDVKMADPLDLVYKGGFAGNPREIVENPAVAPEMIDNMRDQSDHLKREPEGQ
jgi:hypothetical protein